jgi:predicted dehydrogenase
VLAFNSIYGHLEVVQKCAPRGIHVMVEKPLAVNLKHAKEMEMLATENNIQLLTNYETTWYPTNHKAYEMVNENAIGEVRKIIVRDGHKGPKEIGVNQEFLDWLTDPILNGGGAVIDFGCYGANLITWLMKGEKPTSVYALTKTLKPDVYPKVDDEATIIVNYPNTQGIIQASWNWPFSRKDMDIYGQTGYISTVDNSNMKFKLDPKSKEQTLTLGARGYPYDDPFAFLAGVLRGKIIVGDKDLSSLENNMIVVEILDAAIRSAKTGKEVNLK